ncbi:MAG: DoxX family protein [Thermomicrobiales bacterium]
MSFVVALRPDQVAAHERWFTPDGPYWDPDWSRPFSLPVLLALVSASIVVVGLALLQRIVDDPLWPRPPVFQRLETAAPAILGVQAAITIIYMATQLELFVPNIDLPENALGVLLAGIAITASFSFITGVLTRVGAGVILGLFLLAFIFGTWYEAMEQVIYIGIALYLVAVGRGVPRYDHEDEDRSALTERLRPVALPILRVAAGLSVLIVGFTEKLVAPGLGVAFLQEYPRFNVARELGFSWFTDERFVYAAGIVEVTAGVALISGYLTRVVILALWIPFNLGIPFLPPTELIGHLPILATMYILLVQGTEGIPPVEGDTGPETRFAARVRPVHQGDIT